MNEKQLSIGKWKLQNITKLKKNNAEKHRQGVEKLKEFFKSE